MCCGGNISHVWPVHSITGRGCFSGLYIITHVLFIFLRSMVMQRGGASKMDATGRLTYRLPNRDKEESRPPFAEAEMRLVAFPLGAHLLCLTVPQMYTPVPKL